MVPISFDQQILSGTFEHSINYLVDHQLDLTIFHHRFKNDDTGRPAYDPAILLKIVQKRGRKKGDGFIFHP